MQNSPRGTLIGVKITLVAYRVILTPINLPTRGVLLYNIGQRQGRYHTIKKTYNIQKRYWAPAGMKEKMTQIKPHKDKLYICVYTVL